MSLSTQWVRKSFRHWTRGPARRSPMCRRVTKCDYPIISWLIRRVDDLYDGICRRTSIKQWPLRARRSRSAPSGAQWTRTLADACWTVWRTWLSATRTTWRCPLISNCFEKCEEKFCCCRRIAARGAKQREAGGIGWGRHRALGDCVALLCWLGRQDYWANGAGGRELLHVHETRARRRLRRHYSGAPLSWSSFISNANVSLPL